MVPLTAQPRNPPPPRLAVLPTSSYVKVQPEPMACVVFNGELLDMGASDRGPAIRWDRMYVKTLIRIQQSRACISRCYDQHFEKQHCSVYPCPIQM